MRACIIYVESMQDRAKSLASELELAGYIVCLHVAPAQEVREAQAGVPVSQEIERCLAEADVCFFLVQEELERGSELGLTVLRAVSLGKSIIGIVDGVHIPELIDDHAASILGANDAGHLDAAKGAVVRTHPAASKTTRKIDRVKCQ